ncbi:MAG TPA: site-2 protease family protein [Cytophagales bacterium]|nr:site-2 protease family protein [Cytophagales bacterium]
MVYFYLRPSIIIHEIGHVLAAKVVGMEPFRMVIGAGEEIYRWRSFGVVFIINRKIINGHVYSDYGDRRNLKLKTFIYASGGLIMNLIIALSSLVIYFIFSPTSAFLNVCLFALFFTNTLLFIYNIIPKEVPLLGMNTPNDGKTILKSFSLSIEEIEKVGVVKDYMKAFEFYEKKNFLKALEIWTDLFERSDMNSIKINIASCYIKTNDYNKAIEILLSIPRDQKDFEIYKALIFNDLSWAYLLKNDEESLKLAEEYSSLAIQAAPKEQSIIGTRGAVLNESGYLDAGIDLLKNCFSWGDVSSPNLCMAISLAYAHYSKQNFRKGNTYMEFASKNIQHLSDDELHYYELMKGKLEMFKKSEREVG